MSRSRQDEFSEAVKKAAFHRSGGRCENVNRAGERCPNPVERRGDKCRFNHRIAVFYGGKPVIENCEVLCLACDAVQTYLLDPQAMSKTRRIEKRKHGYRRKNYRPIPGGRGTRWKRKLGSKKHPFGKTVRRLRIPFKPPR